MTKNHKELKVFIAIVIEVIIVGLLCANIFIENNKLPSALEMNIGDAIEASILVIVSYFLVSIDKEKQRQKDSIIKLINKIQNMLLDFNDFKIDSDKSKKITRVKVMNISNYIDILQKSLENNPKMNLVIQEKESLSSLILDHIDNTYYIEESRPDILKHISTINMNLEQIIFDIV